MGAHIVFAQQVVALEGHGGERVVRLLDGSEQVRVVVVASRRVAAARRPRLEALVGSGVFSARPRVRAVLWRPKMCSSSAPGTPPAKRRCISQNTRAVTLLVRGDSFASSMSSYLVRGIESTPNVIVRHRTEVVGGGGAGRLEHLQLADRANGTVEEVSTAALFIMIGGEPHTQWLPDDITATRRGT